MRMNVNVQMASGDVDEWEDAADAINDRGSLIVVGWIGEDEVPEDMKIMEVSREVMQYPPADGKLHEQPPPTVKTTVYQVLAEYAPGMWMKVEFE